MGISLIKLVYLVLFTSILLFLFLVTNLNTADKSRSLETVNTIESTLKVMMTDEMTLNVSEEYLRENILIIENEKDTKDNIETRFTEYINQAYPDITITNFTATLVNGTYGSSNLKLIQKDFPSMKIKVSGCYPLTTFGVYSSSGIVPFNFTVTVQLSHLDVGTSYDHRDSETISGSSTNVAIDSKGSSFSIYGIN